MGFEWVRELLGMRLSSIHWESKGTNRSQAVKMKEHKEMFNIWTVTTIPVIFWCIYINMSVPMKMCCYTSVDCRNILAQICDVSFLFSKGLTLHNCAIQDAATNYKNVLTQYQLFVIPVCKLI